MLNHKPMTMIPEAHRRALEDRGFLKLEALLAPSFQAALTLRMEELFAAEGDQAGAEFRLEPGSRRLANLVDKDPLFASCIARPELLPYVGAVIGDRFKLSSLNGRSAEPHNGVAQPLHADGGSLPDERGSWVCNLVLMLDDFTRENGPLRVVPGTHRSGRLPGQVLSDPAGRHPDEEVVTGRAGDVVVMNAHMWHGGMANETDRPRRALHVYFTRWDKPQQQYQKRLLRPEVAARLSPTERALCALDDTLNDELCATGEGKSGFLK